MVDWGRKGAEINAFIYSVGTRDYPEIPTGQDGTGAGREVEIRATVRLLRARMAAVSVRPLRASDVPKVQSLHVCPLLHKRYFLLTQSRPRSSLSTTRTTSSPSSLSCPLAPVLWQHTPITPIPPSLSSPPPSTKPQDALVSNSSPSASYLLSKIWDLHVASSALSLTSFAVPWLLESLSMLMSLPPTSWLSDSTKISACAFPLR